MVSDFSKESQLIKTISKALYIFINCSGAFGPLSDLMLELFDVATTWFGVSAGKCGPNISCGGRTGHRWLHSEGESTDKGAVDQLILPVPRFISWVWCGCIVDCEGLLKLTLIPYRKRIREG